jgi:hypothetical protein
MKHLAAVAFTALLLGACGFTGTGDAIRAVVKERGAQAFDEGLKNAEWYICKGASVGSVQRQYGETQETADTWRRLCLGQRGVELIGPAGDE